MEKLQRNPNPTILNPTVPESDLIAMSDHKPIGTTPRSIFFNLLRDFYLYPNREVREQAIEVLRKNPTILGSQLDDTFAGEISKFTDLIYNKNDELPLFLVDMMGILEGENLHYVKRFFTIMLDNDPERFLAAYSRTKDTNCMIATLNGFKVIEEELLNEYYERDQLLTDFLEREKIDPSIRSFANKCQLVLRLKIGKLKPATTDEEGEP